MTVVMVLHDINQSLYYSDEIIAMKDGKICAQGEPKKIITSELIKEVYGIDLQISDLNGKPFILPVEK
jgi:iron complex transport system ATP-binding protein